MIESANLAIFSLENYSLIDLIFYFRLSLGPKNENYLEKP